MATIHMITLGAMLHFAVALSLPLTHGDALSPDIALSLLQKSSAMISRHGDDDVFDDNDDDDDDSILGDTKFWLYGLDEYEPRFSGSLNNCARKGADYMFLEQIRESPNRVVHADEADIIIVPCLFESFRRCTTTNFEEQPPKAADSMTDDDGSAPVLIDNATATYAGADVITVGSDAGWTYGYDNATYATDDEAYDAAAQEVDTGVNPVGDENTYSDWDNPIYETFGDLDLNLVKKMKLMRERALARGKQSEIGLLRQVPEHPEDVEEVPWEKSVDAETQQCLSKVMASDVYKAKGGKNHFWLVADWAMNFGRTVEDRQFQKMTVGRIETIDKKEAKIDRREAGMNQSRCSVVVPYASDVAYEVDMSYQPSFEDWQARPNLVSFRFEDRQYTFFCKNRPASDPRSCPDAFDATPLRKHALAFADQLEGRATVAMGRLPIAAFTAEVKDAKFCLVIRGDTPSTHGLYDALAASCIPVLISDRFDEVAAPMGFTFDGLVRDGFDINRTVIRVSEADWMNNTQGVIDRIKVAKEDYELFHHMQRARKALLWSMPNSTVSQKILKSAMKCMDDA